MILWNLPTKFVMDKKLENAIEEAFRRGARIKEQITRDQCYDTATFVEKTGTSEQWLVDLSDHKGSYLYLEDQDKRKWWPSFQIDEEGLVLPGFNAVNALLKIQGYDNWTIYGFWTDGNPDAEHDNLVPNIVLLRRGQLLEVISNASHYMEQGGRGKVKNPVEEKWDG